MKRPLTELSTEFTLTSELLHWAASHQHTHIVERFEWFCDYARASGKRYVDWNAAFRNSVRSDWAKMNKPRTYSEVTVEMGHMHGIDPKPGESMESWQTRIRQARH